MLPKKTNTSINGDEGVKEGNTNHTQDTQAAFELSSQSSRPDYDEPVLRLDANSTSPSVNSGEDEEKEKKDDSDKDFDYDSLFESCSELESETEGHQRTIAIDEDVEKQPKSTGKSTLKRIKPLHLHEISLKEMDDTKEHFKSVFKNFQFPVHNKLCINELVSFVKESFYDYKKTNWYQHGVYQMKHPSHELTSRVKELHLYICHLILALLADFQDSDPELLELLNTRCENIAEFLRALSMYAADNSLSHSQLNSKRLQYQEEKSVLDSPDVESFEDRDPTMSAPRFTSKDIKYYFRTRWLFLIPSWSYIEDNKAELNPFPALREVTWKQWQMILCATAAWTWDAFDFFVVTLNIHQLSKDLDSSVKSITMGITLVLMLRSAGAIVFGVLGDKYGTRWPFVANLLMMAGVQVGFSFVTTYQQFLGLRACFGFIMGGIYGSAAATALSDCSHQSRGFISGVLQLGYPFGYLVAVIFNRALADTQRYKWRAVYWMAACITCLIAAWRAYLPETKEHLSKSENKKIQVTNGIKSPGFFKMAGIALSTYWLVAIYLVLLMAGFSFMAHGTQDLYPTYLSNQLKFSKDAVTVTMCVSNIGALIGGLIFGHLSSFIGRRFCIILCVIACGAVVYPWGFVHNTGINAAAFFMQFFVQGAFGGIPAHLTELAHPDFKVVLVGLAYQLGNLASSASSTIETQLGTGFPLPGGIYDYGKVMTIFTGCVFGYVLLITFLGPENSRAVRTMEKHRGKSAGYVFENDNENDNDVMNLA